MTSSSDTPSRKSELTAVVIENVNGNACVLYPPDATDEQLETMWILADGEETYTHAGEIR
ncbi:hypothetical protein HYG81_18900 [Natrinema zhouii]|uniref:DUF7511 domain-containing protein n=1 Tax=Natrinema zhouii TaxID=1710539 RepID=UPI001CFFF319|nr:hypothetical protein [Natrinema zhouii]UHQ97930.1 hypothetical protein HYG81_18900 [Natrinema zhouii]